MEDCLEAEEAPLLFIMEKGAMALLAKPAERVRCLMLLLQSFSSKLTAK